MINMHCSWRISCNPTPNCPAPTPGPHVTLTGDFRPAIPGAANTVQACRSRPFSLEKERLQAEDMRPFRASWISRVRAS